MGDSTECEVQLSAAVATAGAVYEVGIHSENHGEWKWNYYCYLVISRSVLSWIIHDL
jgi:hypothetical protein